MLILEFNSIFYSWLLKCISSHKLSWGSAGHPTVLTENQGWPFLGTWTASLLWALKAYPVFTTSLVHPFLYPSTSYTHTHTDGLEFILWNADGSSGVSHIQSPLPDLQPTQSHYWGDELTVIHHSYKSFLKTYFYEPFLSHFTVVLYKHLFLVFIFRCI